MNWIPCVDLKSLPSTNTKVLVTLKLPRNKREVRVGAYFRQGVDHDSTDSWWVEGEDEFSNVDTRILAWTVMPPPYVPTQTPTEFGKAVSKALRARKQPSLLPTTTPYSNI